MHLGDVHHHYSGIQDGRSAEDKRWESFLQALSFERMDFRLAAITPAQEETCRWIFQRPEYLRWRDPTLRNVHRGLFWIKGKAGVGKSTIMRCILENAIDDMRGCCIISFFFNAIGQPLESSIEGMYRSLLHQLLQKLPSLQHVVTLPQLSVESQTWEPDVLRDIFRKAILGSKGERIICIIDALDEGEQTDIRRTVESLENLTEAAQFKNISLEVCYASRHYPAITAKACETITVEHMPEHAEDIHFYVSNELRISNGPLRDDLRLELVERSQAVFLWVVLVVRRLNEAFDEGARRAELLEVVRSLPTNLRSLLRNIVANGTTDERLLSAVTWMLFAQYTLNIRELYYAIRLSLHQFKAVDMIEWCCHDTFVDQDLERMQRFVLDACRGLVEVRHLPKVSLYSQRYRSYLYKSSGPLEKYDDTYFDHFQVQFIHETVRKYLIAEGLAALRPGLQPGVAPKGHALIAEWCVLWVKSAGFVYKKLPEDPASKLSRILVTKERLERKAIMSKCDWTRFPLFAYVRHATLNHLNAAFLGGAKCAADLQAFPIKQWIDISRMLQHHEQLGRRELPYAKATTLLYFMLESGFRGLARYHLKPLAQSSSESGHHQKPNGMARSAKRDIGRLLNVPCGGYHSSCLGLAACRGYSDMVQLLLDHGADPRFPDAPGEYPYGSALTQAVHERHDAIVHTLLDHDAEPNVKCGGRHTDSLHSNNVTITFRLLSDMIRSPAELAGRVQRSLIRRFSISGKRLSELMSIVSSREISALDYISILLKFGANPNADYIEHGVDAVALILWIASIPEDTQTIAMARMLLQA